MEKGHFEMPLPFREKPQMPDNRQLAENRLNQLKRKLMKDEKYKENYMKYMSDIIKRGVTQSIWPKRTALHILLAHSS